MNDNVRAYIMRRREIAKTAKILLVLSDLGEAVEYLERKVEDGLLSESDGDKLYQSLGDYSGMISCGEIESIKSHILALFN